MTIKEAQDLILSCVSNADTERISINEAIGRVLAVDIKADRDYPPFNRSAMDGYAVKSSDFTDGKAVLTPVEKVLAGSVAKKMVVSGTCIKIMTGAPVPEGADAVIKVEECEEQDGAVQMISFGVQPWKNIARQGEDSIIGDLLISANSLLTAASISVLAVTGNPSVEVYKLPSVQVVSTGNEIVPVDSTILPHQIRDSNSYAIKALFNKYNIVPKANLHVVDDKIKLKEDLGNLMDNDILILSGGVSKGDADFIPEVLQELGVKKLFHRVKIKPGAPIWFGKNPNGGVVFALPGNPVAVQVAFKVFIEPYLRAHFGLKELQPHLLPLLVEKRKAAKVDQFFPVKYAVKDGITGVVINRMNGSGDIAATLDSDGIALHPTVADELPEKTIVEFYPW